MSSPACADLSADLTKRYLSARQRFLNTSNASTSGTPTTSKTTGATELEASPAPTTSTGLTRCIDDSMANRLEHLAFAPRPEGGPPLETYSTTTTEHGEVYRATADYVRWMRSRYPGYGTGSHSEVTAPSRPIEGAGKPTRFKQHSPLDTGA